jgi:hypothetical protein
MRIRTADPLIGCELIRVSLEATHVHLDFLNTQVQIGSDFNLSRDGGCVETICPTKRSGDIALLWEAIGTHVTSLTWPDGSQESLSIVFDNGAVVEILPTVDMPRGTILGTDGTSNFVDDF